MSSPTWAAVLSIIASAVATAILRYSAYRWPTGYHDARAVKRDKKRQDDEEASEGS